MTGFSLISGFEKKIIRQINKCKFLYVYIFEYRIEMYVYYIEDYRVKLYNVIS